MIDTTTALDRERMRQWVANWRLVNDARNGLTRSEPPPDPVACLERGLSLIEFARRLRASNPQLAGAFDVKDESVRETWRRLHDAHGR